MKTTTDTFTGKPFRWNSTCQYELNDGQRWVVPQRMTNRTAMWLHPERVVPRLLAALNDGRVWKGYKS